MATVNHAALKALRIKDGYSISDFARAVGLTRAHVSNVESGRRACSPGVIKRMAEVLNVPISAIEGRDTEAVA